MRGRILFSSNGDGAPSDSDLYNSSADILFTALLLPDKATSESASVVISAIDHRTRSSSRHPSSNSNFFDRDGKREKILKKKHNNKKEEKYYFFS